MLSDPTGFVVPLASVIVQTLEQEGQGVFVVAVKVVLTLIFTGLAGNTDNEVQLKLGFGGGERRLNIATQVLLVDIVTCPLALQSPPQLAKLEPEVGNAVRATEVPEL